MRSLHLRGPQFGAMSFRNFWLYVCFGTVVVTHAQVHRTLPDKESEELPRSSQRAVVKKKRSVKREKNEEVIISDGEDLEGQSFFVSSLVWLLVSLVCSRIGGYAGKV